MRKALLTSALAVAALTASAQSEVARPAGNFEFVTKNLTVDGKTIPASVVTDEENGEYVFTIYNSSFNKERSFSLPIKKYPYTVNTLEAKTSVSELTSQSTVLNKEVYGSSEVNWYDQNTMESKSISTFDDWKAYVRETYGDNVVAFTDADGNFAYHYDGWTQFDGTKDDGLVVRQNYYYYDKNENTITECSVQRLCQVPDNLSWTEVSSEEVNYSSETWATSLKDYDNNCAESYDNYLTQGLFNNDSKFEVVMREFKETTAEDAGNDITNVDSNSFPYEIVGVSDDEFTLRKTEQDKYYKSYLSIVNEDGQEVVALPESSSYLELAKVDGKLYMMVVSYVNGQEQTIIYSVDNDVNTSITELARTNAVKSTKTFNMSGMQVSKNAKGIVIQQGGKKYLNR